ncbi:hypothetical protein K470DRAFT_220731 [Piedraia hortae CBS 480.64]|uniref:Transcription factor BYE1 n=1 Tax=Piedraia hortae CBS 480.64 TaxID=1314780 RepID=A0A6A7BVX9_9PEZI|nr:hypothetical protein K470DRAFT_220731 [Piedraia hortae CBS 480.64]
MAGKSTGKAEAAHKRADTVNADVRRSGRATKGQYRTSSSPPPKRSTKKSTKKSSKAAEPEASGEEDAIRCICGDDNPLDKRAFIGCEQCLVWQHNVCMGITDEEEDTPEHYWCEKCRPEEHVETVLALRRGTPIWETRTHQFKGWKKMSTVRRKTKDGQDLRQPWLMRDIPASALDSDEPPEIPEVCNKRKRKSVAPEADQHKSPSPPVEDDVTPEKQQRPEKRRKSVAVPKEPEADKVEPVGLDKLPTDRKKVAEALSKIIADHVQTRAKSGFRIPDGETAKSLGERYGCQLEYACCVNLGGPKEERYKDQFRTLNANLKKNKALVEGLLDESLSPKELSVMEAKDMLSAEAQKQQAKLKEELDRQAIAVQDDGPMYKQTHKGYERVETEVPAVNDYATERAPIRERAEATEAGAQAEQGGKEQGKNAEHEKPSSPIDAAKDTAKDPVPDDAQRRPSVQPSFDLGAIWSKTTAHSPTARTPANPLRPMQHPPRRRSSVATPLQPPVVQPQPQPQPQATAGAKDDPDVDRLLQEDHEEDEEEYTPAEVIGDASVVWSGKLGHQSEGDLKVNARYVAGKDISPSVSWNRLLPNRMEIDGRLAIDKAETYLSGLQWSHTSDVTVLALSPLDDKAFFDRVFDYFKVRARYAVINKDKPAMIRDIYVIPLEVNSPLPTHVQMLDHNAIKMPVEERVLLITMVVPRNVGACLRSQPTPDGQPNGVQTPGALPHHMRVETQGPAGSPMTIQKPAFSPPNVHQGQAAGPTPAPLYPPHVPQQAQFYAGQRQAYAPLPIQTGFRPLVLEILGEYINCPTAMQIVSAEPTIGRDELQNLRKILEEDVSARTNLTALAAKLGTS